MIFFSSGGACWKCYPELPYLQAELRLCLRVSLKITPKMLPLSFSLEKSGEIAALHCSRRRTKVFTMSAEDRTHGDQMKLQRIFSLGISNSEDKLGNRLPGEAEDFPSLEALRTSWANPYQGWLGRGSCLQARQCSSQTPKVCSSPAFYDFIVQPHWRALRASWKVCGC